VQVFLTPVVVWVLGIIFPVFIALSGVAIAGLLLHPPEKIPWLFRPVILIGSILKLTAIFSPAVGWALLIHSRFPAVPQTLFLENVPPHVFAWIFCGCAVCGIFWAVQAYVLEGTWRLLQARQIKNIPTSRVRSAAIGLCEFIGKARSLRDGEGSQDRPILTLQIDIAEQGGVQQELSRFYLEDETGRILVDPGDAEIRPGWQALMGRRIREIVLTRHVEPATMTRPEVRTLLPGDPIYVLGSVQSNPDSPEDSMESEALVVKPLTEPDTRSPFSALRDALLGEKRERRDFPHVFFLSDTPERKAYQAVLRGAGRILFLASLYLSFNLGVILHEYPRFEKKGWTTQELYTYLPMDESFPMILQRFRESTDSGERVYILDRLDMAYGKEREGVIDLLVETMAHDPDPEVNHRAAYAILRNSGLQDYPVQDRHAPFLLEALEHKDPFIRRTAAGALASVHVEPGDALPGLLPLLKDPDKDIQSFTIRALRSLGTGGTPAAETLMTMIRTADHRDLAWEALRALPDLQPDPEILYPFFHELLISDVPVHRSMGAWGMSVLGQRAEPAIPDLIRALDQGADPASVAEAVESIGPKARKAGRALLPYLRPDESRQSEAILQALRAVDLPLSEVSGNLLSLMDSKDHWLRLDIMELVGKLRDSKSRNAIPFLLRGLKDESFHVREEALDQIGAADAFWNDREIIGELERLEQREPSPDLQRSIRRILSLSGRK